MSSNTKIVVLRSKELVYALVLLVVSVLIIMVAVSLFIPSKDSASPVPTQNTEEPMEQVPSQTPSQTAPKTSPSTETPKSASPGNTQNTTPNENTTTTPSDTLNDTPSGTTTPGSTLNGTSSNTTTDGSVPSAQGTYVPGIYSSTLLLGNMNVELQVAVDKDHINSITLTNLDESVTTLYPLMRPTLSELSAVILSEQSIENVSYSDENRYTSMLLLQAISEALDKAYASENADRPENGIIY